MLSEVQEGETPPKMRQAREDDRLIIARDILVMFPSFHDVNGVEMPEREMRLLWSVKSKDIHVELTEDNIIYCLKALEVSEEMEPQQVQEEVQVQKSPKRKKRKRKPVDGEGQNLAEKKEEVKEEEEKKVDQSDEQTAGEVHQEGHE